MNVATSPSPVLDVFYCHYPLHVLCDSGAESSLIKLSVAKRLGLDIKPTVHSANQADGVTKMTTCGEVFFTLTRGDQSFPMEAIVMKDLGCDVIGGTTFLERNGIVLDLPQRTIHIGNKISIPDSSTKPKQPSFQVRRTSTFVLRANTSQVILPGEFLELPKPKDLIDNSIIAIEPRTDTADTSEWMSPLLSQSIDGTIRIPNESPLPVSVDKHQHVAQIHYTLTNTDQVTLAIPCVTPIEVCASKPSQHSNGISIDPSHQLTREERRAFANLHQRYDQVFNSQLGKYNDASGPVRASINMGPVPPPPHKARLPSYNTEKLRLLQDKMDELEEMGVLAKPESVGVVVEYSSPSFLVKKPDDSHRLVTAFNTIASYARPPPSRSTSIKHIMTFLAQHRYVIKSDMTKQFFQLPMLKYSQNYLGTLTPYKGLRVYTRAAMGMPGSTEHLDELMSRVLGDLLQDGTAIKIADDLYTGGNSITELLHNWERILKRFEDNNLRLSASKTVICPVSTTILGWQWSAGTLTTLPHKITPLATATLPKTVKNLRSWLGAYKHLNMCLPQCSNLLASLESFSAGKESKAKLQWTTPLEEEFKRAQAALQRTESIIVPRPDDKLIITNDGAVTQGVGAVLYILRGTDMHVGGYFSAKLKPNQRKWLPCEVEALAIHMSLSHWSHYILENNHTVQVLTDSRPCIQAFAKLCRGEFSHSARVSTFLSTLSRYQVNLQYIKGATNLPADFHSRNPQECNEQSCQICKFVDTATSSTVYQLTVSDVLNGRSPMPYLSLTTWKVTQQDCPMLRRTYAHLSQGTRPGRKDTNIGVVKRYLRVCTIGKNGVLVVRKEMPYDVTRDLIVVPQKALTGLLSALHIHFKHPKKSELESLFHRYYFALDNSDKEIASVTKQCPQCAALQHFPREIEEFSTSQDTQTLGSHFACDIMCRCKQRIFVIRDSFSSYTITRLIPDEKTSTLKSAILETTAELKAPSGCTVRVDGARAFQALVEDSDLRANGVKVEIGRVKNRNKNPIAEKAIQELESELKREYPYAGQVSSSGFSMWSLPH